MSVLRILRNLAVLVILAMAVLGSPRPAVAKKKGGGGACLGLYASCPNRYFPNEPCCPGLRCAFVATHTECWYATTSLNR